MSVCRKICLAASLAFLLTASATILASPIQPTAKQLVKELERPQLPFVPARVGWTPTPRQTPDFNLTFEQYGPQATARAVRASLLAALTPDPVALLALLFCAFALRWMRMRKPEQAGEVLEASPVPEVILPKAA